MKLRHLLLAALGLLSILSCTAAASSEPKVTTPATAAEIDYWKKLQADITAVRAANASYQAKTFANFTVAQLNEMMSRFETFLDARDADPVDQLGADIQAYREQILAMFDAALTPLRLIAQARSTTAGSGHFNPRASMENFLRANAQLRVIDGFKPALYRLHLAIDQRMGAAKGPRILFFRSLNIGDNPNFEWANSTPAQRDERFVAASREIDPALGVLAEQKFLRYRADGRLEGEILAKRDELLKSIDHLGRDLAKMSHAELDQQLAGVPPSFAADERALLEFAINLEKRRRTDAIGASVLLQDWNSAVAQWLGKADELTPTDGCNHLTVSTALGLFAYSPDGASVIVRRLADGAPAFTAKCEHAVRGLVFGADDKLYAFTTGGMFNLDAKAAAPAFAQVSTIRYQTLAGAIAAATERERFVYAWGAAPAIADAGRESLLKANWASRITAAAMDPSGRTALLAYSGGNDSGTGDRRWGIDVLTLAESQEELMTKGIASQSLSTSYKASVTAVAISADARYSAVATSANAFGTVELFDLQKEGDGIRTLIALDDQPYHFVAFTGSGENLSVIAGAKNGLVRVWSVATGRLTARYPVPTGPQGLAMNVVGDRLVTASLGAPGLYAWSATDGKLLATWEGDAPTIDDAKISADLRAEQDRWATVEKFRALGQITDPAQKAAVAEQLLASDGPALDAGGLRKFVENAISDAREDEIDAHIKAKKYTEAYQLGRRLIDTGVGTRSIYYQTINASRHVARAETTKLIASALELFPTSTDIRYQHHYQRQQDFTAAGRIDDALKEIDELDQIFPESRPHPEMRQTILFAGADRAYKAGNVKRAIDLYVKSLDYCATPKEQLNVLPSIFSLAYHSKNWDLCVRVANAMLNLDANKKNDKQFMDAARYAYQMNQQGKR